MDANQPLSHPSCSKSAESDRITSRLLQNNIALGRKLRLYNMKISTCLLVLGTTTSVAAFVPRAPFVSTPRPSASASTSSSLAVAVDTSDIKNGMTIELDGEPYKVLSFSIMKQARGAAKTTIKFKNLMRGNTIENTYRSGEKVRFDAF